MQWILTLDRELFLWLNGLYSPFSDAVMTFASGKLTWLPLYIIIIALVWRLRGWRQLLWFLLGAGLCVLLADQGSVFLKNIFMRPRPCHSLPALGYSVHLPNGHCGGLYGFVSSHAANVFSIAYLSYRFVRTRWFGIPIFLWATLVGISRIFMGVHYPADVICGAILGGLVGILVYFSLRKLSARGR